MGRLRALGLGLAVVAAVVAVVLAGLHGAARARQERELRAARVQPVTARVPDSWSRVGSSRPAGSIPAAENLPPEGPVLRDFKLLAARGGTFGREDLQGRVWIVDFIFSRCAGPCPEMSRKMAGLQEALRDVPGIGLLTVSVDPAFDTVPVLRAYADSLKADEDRWVFLTGERERIYELVRHGFHLSVEDSDKDQGPGLASMPILHSTRFVLLDDRSRIRGYFDSADEDSMDRLRDVARRLAGGEDGS